MKNLIEVWLCNGIQVNEERLKQYWIFFTLLQRRIEIPELTMAT